MQPLERSVDFTPSPVPDGEVNDGRTLRGYGAVFNQPTHINNWEGNFQETIAPGAFTRSLSKGMPIMQYDHGRDSRVGSVPIGSYTDVHEDEHGLYVEGRLFDNAVVEPVRQAIEGEGIRGMSFRMNVVGEEWRDNAGQLIDPEELRSLLYDAGRRGPLQRTLTDLDVAEVGPVARPAYTGTSVGVRSIDGEGDGDLNAGVDRLVESYRRTYKAPVRDAGPQDVPGPPQPPVPTPIPGDKAIEGEPGPETIRMDKVQAILDRNRVLDELRYKQGKLNPKHSYDLGSKDGVASAWAHIHSTEGENEFKSHDRRVMKDKIQAAADRLGVKLKLPRNHDDAVGTSRHTTEGKAVSMANIDELRARLDEIEERLLELGSDETRSLSDDEQTEFDGLVDERSAVTGDIKKIEDRTEALRSIAASRTGAKKVERGADRGTPALIVKTEDRDVFDMDRIRMEAGGNPDRERVLLRDNAMRAVERAEYDVPEGYSLERAQDQVALLLRKNDPRKELARLILATGSEAYERAFGKLVLKGHNAYLTEEERYAIERAQALSTDSAGGYAVPFQLDPTVILDNASTINPIRELARNIQITGKVWEGVTTTGATVTRGAEASTAPDSSITLAQPTVSTNRVQGFIPFSREIEMSWDGLRGTITEVLLDAKAREEDSFITGDGTGTNPGGVVGTYSNTAFTTASVGTFAAGDIYTHETNLIPRFRRNGKFLANKSIYNKVRQFDTAGGAQLWQRIGAGMPSELLGYQAYEASAMTATTTTNSKILMFGDFSQFVIVDRIGMTVDLIPHIFDQANSNRPTGQRGIYALWMNNSKVLVADAFALLKVQ